MLPQINPGLREVRTNREQQQVFEEVVHSVEPVKVQQRGLGPLKTHYGQYLP
jgi:hypothetical protein